MRKRLRSARYLVLAAFCLAIAGLPFRALVNTRSDAVFALLFLYVPWVLALVAVVVFHALRPCLLEEPPHGRY